MKKQTFLRFFACILAMLLLVSGMPAITVSATQNTSDGFEYMIHEDEVVISDYSGTAADLIIPSEIDGYPVTAISKWVFNDYSSIKSITIPDSVTGMSYGVFHKCSNLERIIVSENNEIYDSRGNCNAIIETYTNTLIAGCKGSVIPEGVESIADGAFYYCSGLESITIPDGVRSIGRHAFQECYLLDDISLPDSVVRVGQNAFSGTGYFDNPDNWDSGIEYSGAIYIDSVLIFATMCDAEFTIKQGTRLIADSAFLGEQNLESVIIPDSVEIIGLEAFYACENLENISISDSVSAIGMEAFRNTAYYNDASNWENDMVLYMDTVLIEASNNLSGNYSIKKGTTLIADCAFRDCQNLTGITIPNGVVSIGEAAFSDCFSIESIDIPATVTKIGERAFGIAELKSIRVNKNNKVYDSRNDCNAIIETATNTLIQGCSYTDIPAGIKCIGNYAFFWCLMSEITLPEGVVKIGVCAFQSNRISRVFIPASVEYIDSYVFSGFFNLYVYYGGSELQWNEIKINANNEQLETATIYYNSTGIPEYKPVIPDDILPGPSTGPGPGFEPDVDPWEPSEEDYATDEDTGVSVAGAGDAELKVSELKNGSGIADVDFVILGMNMFKVYDITLQKEGEEVQPEDMVWVRVPVKNPYARVYRMENDGSFTDMEAEYKDGYLIFTTEHFSIYVLAEPERPHGDANGDGNVNVKDATEIQKAVAGLITLSETGEAVADVDASGTVNVKDATAIQKWVAGIETGFPIGEKIAA